MLHQVVVLLCANGRAPPNPPPPTPRWCVANVFCPCVCAVPFTVMVCVCLDSQ